MSMRLHNTIRALNPTRYHRMISQITTEPELMAGATGSYLNGPLLGYQNQPTWDRHQGAPRFDAINDAMSFAAAADINSMATFSLFCRVYVRGLGATSNGRMWAKQGGITLVTFDASSDGGGDSEFRLIVEYVTANMTVTTIDSALTQDRWIDVGVSVNGPLQTNTHVYVDGRERTTGATSDKDGVGARVNDSANPVYYGNRQSLGNGLDGSMAEAAIWSGTVLTAAQFRTLHDAAVGSAGRERVTECEKSYAF